MRTNPRTTLLVALLAGACAAPRSAAPPVASAPLDAARVRAVQASSLTWGPLNPARGDASPRAANLWGDRAAPGPAGFLVRFADGFSSPPHIHNVTYRGVVLEGRVHNDDPSAEETWLPPGSYWTQPRGDAHITAATGGGDSLAYIEIDDGPYLVRPVDQAFEDDAVAINLHAANRVWVGSNPTGVEVAYLWGDPDGEAPHGTLLSLPAGFEGALRHPGPAYHAVVVRGAVDLDLAEPVALGVGGSFGADGPSGVAIACEDADGCVVYVRSEGSVEVVAAP